MEAPWVLACSKLKTSFLQQPPRLVRWGFHPSSLGNLIVGITEDNALCRLDFVRGRQPSANLQELRKAWPETEFVRDQKATAALLQRVFRRGDAVKAELYGTRFQQAVWKQMLSIPAGKTLSYGDVARRIKNPKAVRAVGTACGANPIAVLVPCHRILASNGKLGGYAGGLDIKKRLLSAEGALDRAA